MNSSATVAMQQSHPLSEAGVLLAGTEPCGKTQQQCFSSIAEKYPHWKEKIVRRHVYKCCKCVCDDC